MVFVQDLLDFDTIAGKYVYLYLEDERKKIPMSENFYVADDIFFFEINKDKKGKTLLDTIKGCLEDEAEDSCWHHDIYCSPMEKILNCEIRFPKDFKEVTNKDIFDNCYEIDKISLGDSEVIINIKEGE